MTNLKSELAEWFGDNGYKEAINGESINRGQFYSKTKFLNCFGTHSTSPVIHHHKVGLIRLLCRSQDQKGTTEQKLAYDMECAKCASEHLVVLIYKGKGFTPEAIEWAKDTAASIKGKTILVLSLAEFKSWFSTAHRLSQSAVEMKTLTDFQKSHKERRRTTAINAAKHMVAKFHISPDLPLCVELGQEHASDNIQAITSWIQRLETEHGREMQLSELENHLENVLSEWAA